MGEYEKFLESIPAAERVPEPFTSIDNRLDFLGPIIIDMKNRIEKLEDTLASIGVGEGVIMPKVIEQIPFAYNLDPLQGVTLMEYAPFSGYIKQVSIHWPDGTNALCDVRVGHGTKQFCPDTGYLALNDATPTYPFSEWCEDHEEIWVEMRNTDGVNNHAITVTVILEGAAS